MVVREQQALDIFRICYLPVFVFLLQHTGGESHYESRWRSGGSANILRADGRRNDAVASYPNYRGVDFQHRISSDDQNHHRSR